MTADKTLVERLPLWLRNEAAAWTNLTPRQDEMLRQAADRIEALEAALRHIATAPLEAGSMYPSPAHWLRGIAKHALEQADG